MSGAIGDVSAVLPRGSATGRFTLLTKSQSGVSELPTEVDSKER